MSGIECSYTVEVWKSDKEKYQDHWDDLSVGGIFNDIVKKEYHKLEHYIKEQGFILDFENCLAALTKFNKVLSGSGADLASGSQWLTAYVIKKFGDSINKFYSVDYAEKNIFVLGKKTLEYYGVSPDKVTLCLGSFYDIKLPNSSLDFIIISQAFHHAEDPDKLLQEVSRVLKKEGFLIMVGELFISKKLYLKCYLNYIISLIICSKFFPNFLIKNFKIFEKISKKKLAGAFQDIYFPPDPLLGDHYYLKSQYEQFFSNNGFNFCSIKSKKPNHLSYIIFKK